MLKLYIPCDSVARAVGQLPGPMRAKLSHVVVHAGNETAFGEDRGRFFVLYDRNIKARLSTLDLSETVFHEAVHATLDHPLARQNAWRKAQRRDGGFMTDRPDYVDPLPDDEPLPDDDIPDTPDVNDPLVEDDPDITRRPL